MSKQENRQVGTLPSVQKAIAVFREHGRMLRTREALRAGIHPRTLYAMRDAGILERLDRGVYRLADSPPLSQPDLVLVATKVPRGVLCLISALAFHDLTTQIPHEVYLAVERGTEFPRLDYPPLRIFQFSGKAFTEGIETHTIDAVELRLYSPEKTLADCFKFRNRTGLDVAVEALRLYRRRRTVKVDAILHFASLCRVQKIMQPYLEAAL